VTCPPVEPQNLTHVSALMGSLVALIVGAPTKTWKGRHGLCKPFPSLYPSLSWTWNTSTRPEQSRRVFVSATVYSRIW